MRDRILSVLKGVRNDVDYENCTALIDEGELGSLDVVQIIADLSDEFDVVIRPADVKPKNFNSLDAIVALIDRLTSE